MFFGSILPDTHTRAHTHSSCPCWSVCVCGQKVLIVFKEVSMKTVLALDTSSAARAIRFSAVDVPQRHNCDGSSGTRSLLRHRAPEVSEDLGTITRSEEANVAHARLVT